MSWKYKSFSAERGINDIHTSHIEGFEVTLAEIEKYLWANKGDIPISLFCVFCANITLEFQIFKEKMEKKK